MPFVGSLFSFAIVLNHSTPPQTESPQDDSGGGWKRELMLSGDKLIPFPNMNSDAGVFSNGLV